ncbi:MAG: DoxX family membrane protein [Flavobacterium sp.]|nr:DoxX family membrane protein [Flavobacterium sp.]
MQHPTHEVKVTWLEQHGIDILRISIAIIFFWFGFLKFFDATSAAEEIAGTTIETISFGIIPPPIALPVLAILECTIGVGLLLKKWSRFVIPLLYFQMAGAILPLLIFPDKTWSAFMVPTLLDQYIIKNFILISAAIVISIVARGGKLIADPVVAEKAKQVEEEKAASG